MLFLQILGIVVSFVLGVRLVSNLWAKNLRNYSEVFVAWIVVALGFALLSLAIWQPFAYGWV